MATTVLEELVSKIKFVVDGRGLRQTRDELGRFQGKAKDTSNVLGALRRSMLEAWGARTAINGLAGLAKFVVHTNVEFQRLGASLKTVTGSSEAAGAAFEMIKKFARDTPFSVQEVTTAFVRLKALGLDAGTDSLLSYGNTASAMGKNVLDFVEAVADASTFEFERLKEFGIKASQQGDHVSFTFQGQTTTIRKSAEEVQKYLKDIGLKQFAGAMDEQMKTLGGAFANLNDAVEQFAVEVGESGLAPVIRTIALDITDMVGGSGQLAKTLGEKLGKALEVVWSKLKKLGPEFGKLLDSIPDLIDLLVGLVRFVMDLVEGFAAFSKAVGGVDNALKILLPGLVALKAASIAALGPWGALVAAMLAAIPIAIEAGNAIGMALRQPELERLDRLNGGRTKKRNDKVGMLERAVGGAGVDTIVQNMSDEELFSIDLGVGGLANFDSRRAVENERAIRLLNANDAATAYGMAHGELASAQAQNLEKIKSSGRNAQVALFNVLMRKKKRGKMTPAEKKQLTALAKELDMSTDKGKKGKKAKEPKDSAGLAEVKDRVDELVKAEELRAFHRAQGTTEDREHAAKTAGEARRTELMAEVNRGNLTVLGGQFTRERMMMRDAGLLDEAMRAAPPVLTVNIQRYDVKVDSPITVQVASANASASDIATAARAAMRDVFRGEVRTAIETVRPLQKV